jgi:GcrA cell cycle regulator
MIEVMTWTDERVELLKKLWNDGLSASQIAGEIGSVTRNAVIGKVHRLGLSGRAKAPGSSTPRPRKPASPRLPPSSSQIAQSPRSPNALAPALKPLIEALAEAAPIPNPEIVIPFSERVTIMELRENMCRWPLGDPTTAEFRFCGAKSDSGVPYCTYHCRVAYQPSVDRRRDRRIAKA